MKASMRHSTVNVGGHIQARDRNVFEKTAGGVGGLQSEAVNCIKVTF